MNLKNKLMEVIYIQELGRNKVNGRIWGFVSEILILFTFLKVYGIVASPLTIFIWIIN